VSCSEKKGSNVIVKIIWAGLLSVLLLLLGCPSIKSYYFNAGMRWQYILLFSFLAANLLSPVCRWTAVKLNVLDRPDWRKIHDQPTPLLGGLAVCVAFAFALVLNGVFLPGMRPLLIGATLIFGIGLWDDNWPLNPILKLIVQVAVTLSVVYVGNIRLTLFYGSPSSLVLDIPLTVLWFVGLTNAMNFFDGIDGLAAGISISIATFFGIIAFKTQQPALGWFAVAIIGSCLGFLPHNFRFKKSALLFLGDAGSTFLGFTLAGLAVLGTWSTNSHFVSLTAPVLIFGVLIFDMIYVTASRIKNRRGYGGIGILFSPRKDHLHHRLLFMGFLGKEAVFIIMALSICMGVSSLIIMDQRFIDALLGLLQAVMVLGIIVVLMLKGRDRTPPAKGERRTLSRRKEDRMPVGGRHLAGETEPESSDDRSSDPKHRF